MIDEVWYFLTFLLDTTPFIYLLYRPLRRHLRLPFWATLLITYGIFIAGACGFVWLHLSPYYSLDAMLLYRLVWCILLAFLSALVFTKAVRTKALFVFALIFPFVTAILLAGGFVSQFVRGDSPPYMANALSRLCITVLLYPILLWIWREMGKQADRLTDRTFWRYAWLIPGSVVAAEMLLIENTYETQGVSASDLIARVFLCVGSAFTCWLVFFLANSYEHKARLEDAAQRNQLLIELQAQQYKELAAGVEQTRAARHDLRHHLSAMKVMLNNREYDRLHTYLDDVMQSIPRSSRITICENYTANIVLDHFITEASTAGIPIKVTFRLSRDTGIADADLCVLLGNALENAMDAVLRIPPDKRYIVARALEEEDRVYITFDNSFDGELKPDQSDHFLSRKRNYAAAGVGIASIRAIVEKYGGDIRISTEEGVFRLSVLLYKA